MLSLEDAEKALKNYFRKHFIGQLADLCQVLGTSSRTSVFRRLKSLGYLSSFTHAGRYYTLAEVPQFDAWGVWFYREAGFSQAGTLKETVLKLVDGSTAGMTTAELRAMLRLHVTNALSNTLGSLVRGAQLQQDKLGSRRVYLSADPRQADEQRACQQRLRDAAVAAPATVTTEAVIAVLVEALRAGEALLVEPSVLSSRLQARGVTVTTAQVQQILAHYELRPGKKTAAPASIPSQS